MPKIIVSFLILSSFQVFASDFDIKLKATPKLKIIELKSIGYYINLAEISLDKDDIKTPKLSDYQHQQGFFCDFEDRINKKRKFKLDLGITGVQ